MISKWIPSAEDAAAIANGKSIFPALCSKSTKLPKCILNRRSLFWRAGMNSIFRIVSVVGFSHWKSIDRFHVRYPARLRNEASASLNLILNLFVGRHLAAPALSLIGGKSDE